MMYSRILNSMRRRLFHPLVSEVLEYWMVFFVIIQCNSMFTYVTGYEAFAVSKKLQAAILILTAYLFFRYLAECLERRTEVRRFFPVAAGLYLYLLAFYFLNVRRMVGTGSQKEYIQLFLFFLPVMACVFWMQRELGYGFRFFYCHADLMYVFAGISLFLYVLLTVNSDWLYADVLRTRWYGNAYTGIWCNFYNFVTIRPDSFRTLTGLPLYLNYGLFAEPLMYCIALHTALFTEMFLRENRRKKPWRWIILSLTIITAQSTLCLLLLAAAWGLKSMQILYRRGRKKWILLCVGILAAVLAGLLYQKLRLVSRQSGFVLGQHMEDYYLGLRAFLAKPLLGCGYNEYAFIRSFMTERRLKADPGFSNSIALILAQGGFSWGLFCYLPAVICLLHIRKKDRIPVALWAVGPFGMFAVTIFHYRVFMVTLFAFGYSLLRSSGQEAELWSEREEKGQLFPWGKQPLWKKIGAAGIIVIALCLLIRFLPEPLQRFYYRYQLYFGQAVWKFVLFLLAAIGWAVMIRFRWVRGKLSACRGKLALLFFLLAFHAVFAALLPGAYTTVTTWLHLRGMWSDVKESLLLFLWYVCLLLIAGCLSDLLVLPWIFGSGADQRRPLLRRWAGGALVFAGICTGFFCSENHIAGSRLSELETEIPLLAAAEKAAAGKLYASERAGLFKKAVPQLAYTTTKGAGFSMLQNASVIFPYGEEVQALFDSGYQVTQLSDRYILYSRDPDVIDALLEQGCAWHRSYVYEREENLRELARVNKAAVNDQGELMVDAEHPVRKGTGFALVSGDYTVSVDVAADNCPADADAPVCHLQVGWHNGDRILAAKDLTAADFAEDQNTFELSVTVPDVNDLCCYISAEEGCLVRVGSISVRRSTDYDTISMYNSLHRVVQEEYYTHDGEPFSRPEGYAAKKIRYNRVGLALETEYLDAEGQLTEIEGGYARVTAAYDMHGRKIRDEYFDAQGGPAVLSNGSSACLYSYDMRNRIISYRYLGQGGLLTPVSGGYAVLNRTFNDRDQVTREWYLDAQEEPCMNSSGYAAVEYAYDAEGHRTLQRYLDLEDNLVEIPSGYAETRLTYNENGWIARESYYDDTGELTLLPGGYAMAEYEYDPIGNRTEIHYLSTTGQPCLCSSGYAVLYRTYNEKKQVILDAYGDVDGTPIVLSAGQAAVAYAYDATGNMSLVTYLDSDGNCTVRNDGFAKECRKYNELRQIVRREYLDQNDHLVLLPNGTASETYVYDERGNRIETDYYDTEGKPAAKYGVYTQYHRVYNRMNKITEEWWCRDDGTWTDVNWGYAKVIYTYDETGKETGRIYYNASGDTVEEP